MGQCIRKELQNQKLSKSKKPKNKNEKVKNEPEEFDLKTFINESLTKHNELRKLHSSPELKINKQLNIIAQKYAEYLASKNKFQHSKNKYNDENLGENLYCCSGTILNGNEMTEEWYNEIEDYDFNKHEKSENINCGHFTQVIWNGSKEVGFGGAMSKKGVWYGVANYYPAGNILGDFEKNILKEKQ